MEDGSFLIWVGHQFVEAVHVELADEGQEVVVFEVLGEDFGGEAGDIFDNERIAFRSPANDLLVVRVLPKINDTSTIR